VASALGTVESINVAVVAEAPLMPGRPPTGIDKRPVPGPVRLDAEGVAGDTVCNLKDHGGRDQAVYAYAREDLDFWAAELGRPVHNVGENLTLSGLDCTGAVLGERWLVGDAELVVRSARTPCLKLSGFLDVPDMIKRFIAAGRPGCYLAVTRPGTVDVADRVQVLDRPAHGVTVAELAAAKTGDRTLLERVAGARDDLGERDRQWLDRILARRAG
jgi:MOSC domain-containing protein YiiM